MAGIRSMGRFLVFIVGGLVAIIVGSFMIRGTMHMWDGDEKESRNDDSKDSKEDLEKS